MEKKRELIELLSCIGSCIMENIKLTNYTVGGDLWACVSDAG